jgi:flavin reductase (NADH)
VPYHTEIAMPGPAVASDLFRQVMKVFPSAVSVVTALDEQGLPRGLTCSAVCSLSMDPPTVLVCVNRRNGSLSAIRASGRFAVNLLRSGRNHVSNLFASASPDKFSALTWRPGLVSGMPWLYEDSLACLDGELVADVAVGSHAILVGLVTDGQVHTHEDGPLVYWRQRYGRWVHDAPQPDLDTGNAAVADGGAR